MPFLYKVQILFVIFALTGLTSACMKASESAILSYGGSSSSGDEDTEIATDGDQEIYPTDFDRGPTKCDIDNHSNDREILVETGALLQYCIPGDPLDGTQVEIAPDSLENDIRLIISAAREDLSLEGWVSAGPAVMFDARAIAAESETGLRRDAVFSIPFDREQAIQAIVESRLGEFSEDERESQRDALMDEVTSSLRDYHINVLHAIVPNVKDSQGKPAHFMPKSKNTIAIEHDTDDWTGKVHFGNTEFGVYQVVVPTNVKWPATRRFAFRALAGLSLGADIAAINGFANPDIFDVIASLGGSIDHAYAAGSLHHSILGGFCGYDEITASGNIDEFVSDEESEVQCGFCGAQHDPSNWSEPDEMCFLAEPRENYSPDERSQGYNHWVYDDNGAALGRNERLTHLKAQAFVYGNMSSYNPASPYLAAGLEDELLQEYLDLVYYETDGATACARLETLMQNKPITGFADISYNPGGTYPVIAFCDGADPERRNGTWSPSTDAELARSIPTDILLAVDFNENGIRDYGEPVIRQFWEPFRDCGIDALCDEEEAGYDSVINADPAGDNFNPLTNPTGKENNGLFEENEHFDDFGINGVAEGCTPEDTAACPFDYGEGNGEFDYNPNLKYFLDNSPLAAIQNADAEALKRLNVWMDGGIRDPFNAVLMADGMAGALDNKLGPLGHPTGVYRGHSELNSFDTDDFNFLKVDYGKLGRNVLVRYGDYNADDELIAAGDGRRLGSPDQLRIRLQTLYAFAGNHIPDGGYSIIDDYDLSQLVYLFFFDSESLGREMRYTAILPPGYDNSGDIELTGNPDGCVTNYPVLYFMLDPDFSLNDIMGAFGAVIADMAEGHIQKMITIIPTDTCFSRNACRENCSDKCREIPDRVGCQMFCEERDQCLSFDEPCVQGSDFLNHAALKDNPLVKPAPGGANADLLQELINHVESKLCTRSPEEMEADAATFEALY